MELTQFLLQASCNLSVFLQLGRKFARLQVSEQINRLGVGAIVAPRRQLAAGIIQGAEQLFIE